MAKKISREIIGLIEELCIVRFSTSHLDKGPITIHRYFDWSDISYDDFAQALLLAVDDTQNTFEKFSLRLKINDKMFFSLIIGLMWFNLETETCIKIGINFNVVVGDTVLVYPK